MCCCCRNRAGSSAARSLLDRCAGQPPPHDHARHSRRLALQRPGIQPCRATSRIENRHSRQVPGPGSPRRDLLHGNIVTRRSPPRHGVPLQRQPLQCRHFPRPLRLHSGRKPPRVRTGVPDSPPNEARQRALPLSGNGSFVTTSISFVPTLISFVSTLISFVTFSTRDEPTLTSFVTNLIRVGVTLTSHQRRTMGDRRTPPLRHFADRGDAKNRG